MERIFYIGYIFPKNVTGKMMKIRKPFNNNYHDYIYIFLTGSDRNMYKYSLQGNTAKSPLLINKRYVLKQLQRTTTSPTNYKKVYVDFIIVIIYIFQSVYFYLRCQNTFV